MDKYSVITLIGEGSYGKVFKATENESQKVVALKILPKRGRSTKEIKGLRQESLIQKNLRHPNIIQLLHSFETEKDLVFVTDYASSDLHKLLAKEGSLGEARAQKLTYDLVSALYYLHSHRILHRDLKPPNILLEKQNKSAKLCDFGLARNMTLGTQVLTSIKGTPLYMAPELLEAKPYGHQADLWSLGCIIYEMLAGETPFSTRSILHLVRLIKNGYIKFPSYLTNTCISFLKGLLVNDPEKRMTWPQILDHKFIKGNVLILNEDISESPFTSPLTMSQNLEKEKQSARLIKQSKQKKRDSNFDDNNLLSSRDSIKAIIQSDMEEVLETDNEDIMTKSSTLCNKQANQVVTPENEVKQEDEAQNNQEEMNFLDMQFKHDFMPFNQPTMHNANFEVVPENSNLVINRFYDNFPNLELENKMYLQFQQQNQMNQQNQMFYNQLPPQPIHMYNHELAIQKLNHDLDNFSLRIDKSIAIEKLEKSIEKNDGLKQDKVVHSISTDDSANSPIENEEWLQFLYKSMQEILDGELDIFKQENMITMIVALLRNAKASPKVLENVTQILSLVYSIDMPDSIIEDIEKVYVQVKLVPNLIYASKLLCSKKFKEHAEDSTESPVSLPKITEIIEFSEEELKTLCSLYNLVSYLVYSNEMFLHQFLDAMSILSLEGLFVSFIVTSKTSQSGIRLTSSVISLICAILKELPENASLIEKVIFNRHVKLEHLLQCNNALIRFRACMLLRLLGRFCCRSLQNVWSSELSDTLKDLVTDDDDNVREEAANIIEEFKSLPFYVLD